MTTITNQMNIATIDYVSEDGSLGLTGEVKVNIDGTVSSVSSCTIFLIKDSLKSSIGYFSMYNSLEGQQKTVNINIQDMARLSTISSEIYKCLIEIESSFIPKE